MIAAVILWTNGMVTVFDERGQQVSEYAGRFEEVWQRIYAEAPAARWQIGHYSPDGWMSESFRLGWPAVDLRRADGAHPEAQLPSFRMGHSDPDPG
jgi:hypothetical protein